MGQLNHVGDVRPPEVMQLMVDGTGRIGIVLDMLHEHARS